MYCFLFPFFFRHRSSCLAALSFVMPGTDRASRSSSGLRCALVFRSRRRKMRLPRKPTRSALPSSTGVHRRRSSPVRHCLSFVMPGTDRASRSSSGLRCALVFRSRRREMRLPRKPTRSAPPSSAGVHRRMIIFKDSKFFVSLSYGNEDQECVVLYLVWERESEMDGTVSCLRRMEYDGGRAESTEGIEGRSRRWCGRTAACLYRCR